MKFFFHANKKNKRLRLKSKRKKVKYNKNSDGISTIPNIISDNKTTRKGPSSKRPVSIISIYLKNCGLVSYLQSTPGRHRDIQSINQLVQRVDLFLNVMYALVYKNHRICLSFDVEFFFAQTIKAHYNLIPQFILHMEEKRSLSVSSQLNYLYDIQRSVHWFVLFRTQKQGKRLIVKSVPYYRWIDCIRNVKKPLQHRLALEKAKGNSLQEKVYRNEYPEGGLDQLQNCIKTEIEFVESLLLMSYIDEATFRRFMGILYSALYAFGVQGRCSGNNYIMKIYLLIIMIIIIIIIIIIAW